MSTVSLRSEIAYKRPESVLVVVYTISGQTLLLERNRPVFWQSITGSLKWPDESAPDAAYRELEEETGIKALSGWQNWQHTYTFPILPEYRYRYTPGTSDNQEHLFSLELAETCQPVLSDAEHSSGLWLPIEDAIAKVWSWSNRDALERVAAALNSD